MTTVPAPPAPLRVRRVRRVHRVHRVPALVVLVAVLVGAGLVDRRARPVQVSIVGRPLDSLMPTAASPAALSSAWYCPGASSDPPGTADGSIVVANPTDRPLTATLTLVPAEGAARSMPFSVGAGGRWVYHEADLLASAHVAALVDVAGGGAVVEQVLGGPLGNAVSPCASDASDQWYFPTGSTDRDWTLSLTLFNPFPGDAIVDLSFATDQGPSSPPDFQGLVVPARGLKVVDIGDHVRRRVDVATTVTARSGRVVAGQIQSHTAAPTGVVSTLGAPSTGSLWMFPHGVVEDGEVEQYHLYNPSGRDAEVTVELALDQGAVEPFDLTVPARGTTVLGASSEARIPKGVGHAATVRATNGVGVVVERTLVAGPPSPHGGMDGLLGARHPARQWVFAAGAANAAFDEWVVLFNPGTTSATASFTVLAGGPTPVADLQAVAVPPGSRVAVRLGDHVTLDDLPLLVTSTAPVVAERDVYRPNWAGLSITIGIPAA